MEEIWKDIANYEGIYQVSTYGNVKSIIRNKILRPSIRSKTANYLAVSLSKNNKCKTYNVHTLVANAFLLKNNLVDVINHIDGNKYNNSIYNLEWCSHLDNMKHAIKFNLLPKGELHKNRLIPNDIADVIRSLYNKGIKQSDLGKQFNCSQNTISRIVNKVDSYI